MVCADLEGISCTECKRSEFYLPSCGYVLKPQQGTTIFLKCTKVNHETIANIGYNQYGVPIKKKVLTGGTKLIKKYELDFTI
jgi:hypothetical protein